MIRNSKWTFDAEQYQQSFDTYKLLFSLSQFSKSSLLYIEVWKRRCELPAHQKESFEAWSNHQWSFSWFGYCPKKDQFQTIPSLEEHWCRHSCCSWPIADTDHGSGDSGCTLRTIILFQLSPTKKHPMPSNPFELVVASFFQSSAMLGVFKSFKQPLKLQFSQLLMIFSSWWSSDLLMKTVSGDLQNLFSSDASSFLLVHSISFICSSKTYALKRDTKFFSMVLHTWTNISISNWQFLIPCYHQNLKDNVKHILFQQSPPFWWWQTLVFKIFNCC